MTISISNVSLTDTFQIWLNKTNELIDIANNHAMTASSSSNTDSTNTTTGNAFLIGRFTANTVIASNTLNTNTLSSVTGGSSPISVTSPVSINTGSVTSSMTVISSQGPQMIYDTGTNGWITGFENTSTNAFVIRVVGAGTSAVKITANGEVIASKFTGEFSGTANTANRFLNSLTLQMSGDVAWSAVFNGSEITPVSAAATIQNNVITNSKIRQSVGLSVVGRSANTTGNVDDISAGADGQVLRRSGTTLGFGAIDLANANSVTGVLPVSRGGFGDALTLTAGSVLFAANTTAIGSSSNLFWDNVNGRLGIGTTTPIAPLSVSGEIRSSGNITAFAVITTSDIRFKENVKQIENALDIVENLRGVTFDWKDPNYGGKTYGLIAQEVENVLPELVYENEEAKGIAYANIVSVLIEAIKELKSEVEKLKV